MKKKIVNPVFLTYFLRVCSTVDIYRSNQRHDQVAQYAAVPDQASGRIKLALSQVGKEN